MNITQVWKRSSGAGGRDISWNDILIREPSDVSESLLPVSLRANAHQRLIRSDDHFGVR